MEEFSGTKKRIFEESIRLFAQKGYRATTVREIAKAVGIQQSAIYNHFKNKEDILNTIVSTLSSSSLDLLMADKPIEESAKKGKGFLREFATSFKLLAYDDKSEKFFRFMMIELMQNAKMREIFLNDFHKAHLKVLSQAFFVMMQEGMVSSSDPMLMAQEFLSPLFFYRMQATLLRIDAQDSKQVATLFEKHIDFFWEMVSI
jgi:AcrR family transcriptional regulator